jgi:hypothetical protein
MQGRKASARMKPLPAPNVPGNTEWERFDNAVGKFLSVPKEAFLKEEAKSKRRREKKQAAKKPA